MFIFKILFSVGRCQHLSDLFWMASGDRFRIAYLRNLQASIETADSIRVRSI